ncbi:repressor [Pseudomonas psychrophila]|uniref:LexA family transcriptional regulator n=1 Tax=Pseudomonas psychrophila TaxID=122355 RepID=UPI00062A00CA|nr:LexA family transcriptional regulator [Pseudomonas psychrophila]KOX63832.1 repressor [Pseudomonas psychrophila]
MDINELRIKALRRVMGRASQKDFANEYGLDASYLSQLLNGHRKLGEKAAATLEGKIGLVSGTLVSPPAQSADDDGENNLLIIGSQEKASGSSFITIPQYDVRASMGPGQVVPKEYIETVRNITVRSEYLREQGINYTRVENLAVITGFGESMGATFSSGDPLIVDKGITEVVVDGVYAFTLDGMLYIKRLQRLPKMIRMISDNEAFPTYDIKGAELESLVVHARVLLAWNARRL